MAKGRVRDLAKEAAWRRRLDRHAGSGQTVRAWRRRYGLTEASFHRWRRELARRDAQQPSSARRDAEKASVMSAKTSHRATSTDATFIPVHVTDDPARDDDPQIEIVLTDGRRVRVTGMVNREMLTEVLAVLTSTKPVEAERRAC